MVKLVFNPKNETVKNKALESKTSVKYEKKIKSTKNTESKESKENINFNPFSNIEINEINEKKEQIDSILCCKDLIGLENCHFILQQWYTSSIEKKQDKSLLIIGPTGCGKTTLIELFCKEQEIKILNLKINDNKTKKDLIKEVDYFIDYSSEFFFKFVKIKKLILIDEYQNVSNDILSANDIVELKEKGVPIVIISSDSKGSKLSEFKKGCEVYYINELPPGTLKKWIHSLNVNLTESQIKDLIQNCKSDKRMILNILQFVNDPYFNIESFLKTYHKDIDINIFEFTKKLFDDTDPLSIDSIFKMYDNDGFIVSNLIHENYLDYNQDIESIAKAADCISSGEIFFSDTYESNKSFLPDPHCINSIILPSFYSRSMHNQKGTIRSSIINNRFNIFLGNKKNIAKINGTNFNKVDIYDIYTIKSILNQELIKSKLVQPNKIEFIKNVLGTLKNPCSLESKELERLEMIYKHFSTFKEDNLKTKSFTIKFKEKIR